MIYGILYDIYIFMIYNDMFKNTVWDHTFGTSRSISEAFLPHVGMLPWISHNMECDESTLLSQARPTEMARC